MFNKKILLGWVLLLGVSVPAAWAEISKEEIKPKHVFVQAQRILNEVDLIRIEMGKPEQELLQIKISNAQPREVFFQALTLYKKADRMCFDHTRNTGPIPPKMKEGKILPGDVYEVLERAMIRVRCVSNYWGIAKSANAPIANPYHTPSNVYMKILEVNRELNFLLDVPFSPSTVFRRVLETIQLVENFLQNLYPNIKLAEPPEFVPRMRPRDVYLQNRRSLALLQKISQLTGIQILDFEFKEEIIRISPGDVYDLVSLLFSEIKFIENKISTPNLKESSQKIAFPGRKLPSHVFQKSVYLEKLLLQWKNELEKQQN